MLVEEIKDPADIATIIKSVNAGIKNNIFNSRNIDGVEWVQILSQLLTSMGPDYLKVFATKENGNINNYMVVTYCFFPPLFRAFVIMHQTFFCSDNDNVTEAGREALKLVRTWMDEFNCEQLIYITDDSKVAGVMEKSGFVKTRHVCMRLSV